ncbi:MAG TPA: CBS domain-containing protein [Anaeromyxobacteraceae bacterium]|nr:CBS domain-containing protein [Anaeromyxobacteraceae bacterium]
MALVSEAMNRSVLAVSPGTSASRAVELAHREHAEHVLVLEAGVLVGILCTCDLEGGEVGGAVAERMRLPVPTIRPDATLEEAALTLSESEVGCLAVACGGLVLGTLGEEDLARAGVDPRPGRRPRQGGRRGNMPHA